MRINSQDKGSILHSGLFIPEPPRKVFLGILRLQAEGDESSLGVQQVEAAGNNM